MSPNAVRDGDEVEDGSKVVTEDVHAANGHEGCLPMRHQPNCLLKNAQVKSVSTQLLVTADLKPKEVDCEYDASEQGEAKRQTQPCLHPFPPQLRSKLHQKLKLVLLLRRAEKSIPATSKNQLPVVSSHFYSRTW
jgi:hypothetical protein